MGSEFSWGKSSALSTHFCGGLVLVGSHNGKVYGLDQNTGCQIWAYQASGEVRTGIVVQQDAEDQSIAMFGDVLGNVYGIDVHTGKEAWRLRADDHPNATITGTPSLHDGTLFVPVSALEVSLATTPPNTPNTYTLSLHDALPINRKSVV